jgi:hypothetical protein
MLLHTEKRGNLTLHFVADMESKYYKSGNRKVTFDKYLINREFNLCKEAKLSGVQYSVLIAITEKEYNTNAF